MALRRSRRAPGSSAHGGPLNTTGLRDLPFEILGEIAHQLPDSQTIKSTTNTLHWGHSRNRLPRNAECFQRIDTLRALSVTCRTLRKFALPLAWERIEVCSSKFGDYFGDNGDANKDLASQVSRQLSIATSKQNNIANYVKVVNLILTRDAFSEKGLVRLARALELFENLHTLQIMGSHKRGQHSVRSFEGKVFPNVKTLIINERVLPLLKCCPAATYVDIGRAHPPPIEVGNTTEYIFENCSRQVEEFLSFDAFFNRGAQRYSSTFKATTVVNLYAHGFGWSELSLADVDHFRHLPNLKCIRLWVCVGGLLLDDSDDDDDDLDGQSKRKQERIIQVLRDSPYPMAEGGHKCVITKIERKAKTVHKVVSGHCSDPEDCIFYRMTGPFIKFF